MLTAERALTLHSQAGKELPRIPGLDVIYNDLGVKFRQGQLMMIAGRSGTQKSGFALWLAAQWNLNTLYFSADMSPFTMSTRLACMATGDTTEQVELGMASEGIEKARYQDELSRLKFQLAFGSPITWRNVEEELEAYVATNLGKPDMEAYPDLIVFDNLMDFEGAESSYEVQMEVMSMATELTRETGSSVLILHHATDKSWDAKTDPFSPPGRQEIKSGLSEKPEITLAVALDPYTLRFNVACVKQRSGPSDPTGRRYKSLRCYPEQTRFGPFNIKDKR